jgi:hypothetical protein
VTDMALFDVDDVLEDDSWVVPLPGEDAPACCRFCQTASTAAGIVRHEHGPGSRTCARMLAWVEVAP